MPSVKVEEKVSDSIKPVPFGHVYKPSFEFVTTKSKKDYKSHLVKEYGLEVDKETLGTKVVVQSEYSIQDEIQAAYPSSGLFGVMQLIKQGKAKPSDFYDDGKSGGDFSELPDNVNDAYRQALQGDEASKAIVNGLGLDPNNMGSDLNKTISDRISAIIQEEVAKATQNNQKGDKTDASQK